MCQVSTPNGNQRENHDDYDLKSSHFEQKKMFPPKKFLKRFCDERHYQNVHIVHSPRSATF